jgi:hypothetical protein
MAISGMPPKKNAKGSSPRKSYVTNICPVPLPGEKQPTGKSIAFALMAISGTHRKKDARGNSLIKSFAPNIIPAVYLPEKMPMAGSTVIALKAMYGRTTPAAASKGTPTGGDGTATSNANIKSPQLAISWHCTG